MKILIADDHALFRDSLRGLLEAHGHEVVGEARTGRDAVAQARRLRPDLVLMDLTMPEMNGIEAARQLSTDPQRPKVVILTGSEDDADLFLAIKAGADGYALKSLEADAFFSLLEAIERGEPAFTPAMARKLLQEFAKPVASGAATQQDLLTEREREVLQLMVDGMTANRKIAKQLGVSENTVQFHVRNILDKLHLHSRAQAVGYALRHGLLEPPPER